MAGRQGGEVRQTILVLDNDLAVDQSGMALEFPAGLDHSAVLVRPVIPSHYPRAVQLRELAPGE
jgi:hypothetical protein